MRTVHQLVPKIIVFLLLLTCCLNCDVKSKQDRADDHVEKNPVVEAPSNIVSLKGANAIYDNYSKHRIPLIETYEMKERAPEEKFQASRFVDFDYDTIKQYIDYIDQEAAKAGVKKVTKLRLYFANYPNEEKFPNGKKVTFPRQNSIFMVPTLNKGGIDYGFYINPKGKAGLITDWKASMQKGMGLIKSEQKAYAGFSLNTSLQGGVSLALNFGTAGPPPTSDF